MIKIIKEVITSKVFIIVSVVSIFSLAIYNIWYQNNIIKDESYYSIEYCESIDEYQEKIDELLSMIASLDDRDKYFERNKQYLDDTINIYKELQINNVDYEQVYDFGYGRGENPTAYLIKSESLFIVILVINALVLTYLCITMEFDNNAYLLIYEKKRTGLLYKKYLSIFLIFVIVFILYSLFNYLLSSVYDNCYNYVLLLDSNKANIINWEQYYFTEIMCYELYNGLFLLASFIAISLFFHKTYKMLLVSIIMIGLIYIAGLFKLNVLAILGLVKDYRGISIDFMPFTKLSILIPILFMTLGTYCFNKSDL